MTDIEIKTIKDFAERLKTKCENLEASSTNETYRLGMQDMLDYYVPKIIDNLVKEMTESVEEKNEKKGR